jgi:hypothetical protein
MTITSSSRRALPWAAGFTAVMLVMSAALGSAGTIEGDPDTGQRIANVTFPLIFVGLLALVVLTVIHIVGRIRNR